MHEALLGGAAGEGPRALRRERVAGPPGLRLVSPSPLSSLGGLCSPAAFLPTGVGEASSRKGRLRPLAPGTTPSSSVEPDVFKHTHKSSRPNPVPHSGTVRRRQQKKKRKKIDLVAFSLPWCFGRFPVSAASPGLQGCPVPGGPEIQAFGSGSWQMRYLFVTERREVGEKSSGKSSSSLALVECETPGQHP